MRTIADLENPQAAKPEVGSGQLMPSVGDLWYRVEGKRYSTVVDADLELYASKLVMLVLVFKVIKVTPKGVWVATHIPASSCITGTEITFHDQRFIKLKSVRKFAHPSKIDAYSSYVHRKKRQIHILTQQLSDAQVQMHEAEQALLKLSTKESV